MPKDPPQRPKKPGVKYDLTTCACLVLSCFDFQQRVASTWLRGPRRLEAMMQLSEMGEDEGLLGQGACHLFSCLITWCLNTCFGVSTLDT